MKRKKNKTNLPYRSRNLNPRFSLMSPPMIWIFIESVEPEIKSKQSSKRDRTLNLPQILASFGWKVPDNQVGDHWFLKGLYLHCKGALIRRFWYLMTLLDQGYQKTKKVGFLDLKKNSQIFFSTVKSRFFFPFHTQQKMLKLENSHFS